MTIYYIGIGDQTGGTYEYQHLHEWLEKTGLKAEVPQYELTIKVDFDGREVERTVLFPDILFDLPVPYVKERITDMLVDYATIKVGAKVVE